jgi:hypothetical protein
MLYQLFCIFQPQAFLKLILRQIGGQFMPQKKSTIKVPKGHKLIFRRFRKGAKPNTILDARKYGLKAWPIVVPIEQR